MARDWRRGKGAILGDLIMWGEGGWLEREEDRKMNRIDTWKLQLRGRRREKRPKETGRISSHVIGRPRGCVSVGRDRIGGERRPASRCC